MVLNMRIFLIVILSFFIFLSFCQAGQYYKFVDKNGVVSFTDDISRIPKEKRPEIEITESIKSTPPVNQSKISENQLPDKNQNANALDNEAQELMKIKEELDREAQEINSQSVELIEQNKYAKDNNSIKEYNIKIEELNERTKAYQLKQLEYINRANEYNAKVQKQSVK